MRLIYSPSGTVNRHDFSLWALRPFQLRDVRSFGDLKITEVQSWVFGSARQQVFMPGATEDQSMVFGANRSEGL